MRRMSPGIQRRPGSRALRSDYHRGSGHSTWYVRVDPQPTWFPGSSRSRRGCRDDEGNLKRLGGCGRRPGGWLKVPAARVTCEGRVVMVMVVVVVGVVMVVVVLVEVGVVGVVVVGRWGW